MKFFVESYGCTMNHGEGDRLSEVMTSLGHELVGSAAEADLVILNTCTVVDTTEKHMVKRMSELKAAGKEVTVTGCMAKVQPNRIEIRLPDAPIIPPEPYDLFEGIMESRYGRGHSDTEIVYHPTETIPIAQGCKGACTYCITRLARGKLISRPEDEIVSEFKTMIDSGTKEILLAAQDTACYGKDTGTDLPSLIRRLLEFQGDFRIRIGMMNPNHLDRILDDMIDVLKDPRMYRFLHIPVQSGSNSVLDGMKRQYTAERFMGIVNRLRSEIPDISIATDMITGFPGETDKDHEKSMDLLRKLRADTVNITRFSPRPNTVAMDMDKQVPGNVSKDRSTELTELKNSVEYENNSALVGKRFRVLITEKGRNGSVIGRTDNYRPIGIECDLELGTFCDVEVTECRSTYLVGMLLNN